MFLDGEKKYSRNLTLRSKFFDVPRTNLAGSGSSWAIAHLLYWIFSNEKSLQIGLQDGVAKEHKVDEFQVFYEVVGQLFGREHVRRQRSGTEARFQQTS